MKFLQFDLGNLSAGSQVEITLRGVESDAFLVDPTNFQRLRRGANFEYHGGHYNSSPVRLVVPRQGHWTAVVIPIGGRVEASVSVQKGPASSRRPFTPA